MTAHLPAPEPAQDSSSPKGGPRFVARQPILTADENVFGYELLYRGGLEEFLASPDPMSASMLDVATFMGLDVLCDGRLAFINCTREALLKDYCMVLPPTQTVAEVLETVEVDDQVVAACRRLRDAGYLIALDDFLVDDPRESLVDLADIIKVDVRVTSAEQSAAMVKRYKGRRCRMLAEKVETREEFLAAEKAGFLYFQGYFFRKPELLETRSIPVGRVNYLRLLQTASRSEIDVSEIENIIKTDTSFCYRLLRYLNSAKFSFFSEIRSVRHALSILGEDEVRRWVRLMAMLGAGQNKCSDLVLSALVRARFCELVSPAIQQGGSDLFLLGLLSLMDAILDMPMAQILESIAVNQESRATLMGEASRLRPLYLLMLAVESGDWQQVSTLSPQVHLDDSEVAQYYWEALSWARQIEQK